MIKSTKISHGELIERLNYNAEDGVFTWTDSEKNPIRLHNKTAGGFNCADSSSPKAVLMIVMSGERWIAHQLAWYWMKGEVPLGRISHIDGVVTNNRIDNLRYTPAGNKGQRRIHCGRKGYYFIRKDGKYYGTAQTLSEAIVIRDSFPELRA